jgi:hypothetical protein
MTLTEDGNVALEPTRDRTVRLNFPESMIALRTGAPITPEAWDSRHGQIRITRGHRNTYSDDGDVLDDNHYRAFGCLRSMLRRFIFVALVTRLGTREAAMMVEELPPQRHLR